MPKWVKTLLWVLGGLFALFYILTRPEVAGTQVATGWNAFWGGVGAVITFFTSFANGV